MHGLAGQRADIQLNGRNSRINATLLTPVNRRQLRDMLECFDYLGIDASILHLDENQKQFSVEIKTVRLITVKRCRKAIETMFAGVTAVIESIGGISYKEYLYKISA